MAVPPFFPVVEFYSIARFCKGYLKTVLYHNGKIVESNWLIALFVFIHELKSLFTIALSKQLSNTTWKISPLLDGGRFWGRDWRGRDLARGLFGTN